MVPEASLLSHAALFVALFHPSGPLIDLAVGPCAPRYEILILVFVYPELETIFSCGPDAIFRKGVLFSPDLFFFPSGCSINLFPPSSPASTIVKVICIGCVSQ